MTENKGVIKSLNDKGFGFLKIEGMQKDVFFHASSLIGIKFNELQVGDVVIFDEIEEGEKGKNAIGISLA